MLRLILILVLLTSHVYANNSDSVSDFLKKQTVIRILADGELQSDDLTAQANLIKQLRQLGFDGKFELIYGGKKQISQLFELPNQIPDVYDDKKNNIRFIHILEFSRQLQKHQVQPVAFSASSMFNPNACKTVLNENPQDDFATKMQEAMVCKNPANFLNAETYFDITTAKNNNEESHYYIKNDNTIYALADSKAKNHAVYQAILKEIELSAGDN